ncbi:MAG: hypothetical protein RIE59_13000 [Imperialibacter sp.]
MDHLRQGNTFRRTVTFIKTPSAHKKDARRLVGEPIMNRQHSLSEFLYAVPTALALFHPSASGVTAVSSLTGLMIPQRLIVLKP